MPHYNRLPPATVDSILDLRAAGQSHKAIAFALFLPIGTVKTAVFLARQRGDERAALRPRKPLNLYDKLRRAGVSRADALAAVAKYSAGVSSLERSQVPPSVPIPASNLAAGALSSAASSSGGAR